MDFKFEPGNYYLASREQLEGHDPADRLPDADVQQRRSPSQVRRERARPTKPQTSQRKEEEAITIS
jgi:hypothetical protein